MKKLMDGKAIPKKTPKCESCEYLYAGEHISKIEICFFWINAS